MHISDTSLESRLLQKGCVVLYHSPLLMEEHSGVLVASGWRFQEIYIAEQGTPGEFFDQVALMLNFPDYFGRNLDAFRDCLGDIAFPEAGRLALGLMRFHLLAHRDPEFAHAVLDILAESERGSLINEKRVLFMVQTDDPDLYFPPIGATSATWNFEEWLNSKRKGKT